MTDLAVGIDGGGADAWLWQDTFALGMHIGAPPDEFNTGGQDWRWCPGTPGNCGPGRMNRTSARCALLCARPVGSGSIT